MKKIIILIAIILILLFLTVIYDPGQVFGAIQGVEKGTIMVAPFLM
ncbi:MAG: hypothetical protein GTO16_11815 [Candidatus Aminicenantes bacterium]|nr:hypothetical protein [Candidatus Aminicenantes bacterium]